MLIYATHGTYGRDDDTYGALLAANAALAKGMEVTMLLVEDGVAMAKAGQDPSALGVPNNLDELGDFTELGGRLVVVKEHMEERGIGESELVEGAEVVFLKDIVSLIEGHSLSLTF
jgi:tRNA 2-thiouridine synthesizing protein D